MSIDIRFDAASDSARAARVLEGDPAFGKQFADLMFVTGHDAVRGWHDARIGRFENLSLSPAAKVLHYGLEIFEGFKAYRQARGSIALFRPDLNAKRFNRSAARMALPAVPEALFIKAAAALTDAVRDWVPSGEDGSLYLRPTLIGTEPAIGVSPSSTHLFYIIATPARGYFKNNASTISVRVEDADVRAAAGGVGFAKAGGNYGAGMMGKRRALENGFDEVMWLDAAHRCYIEEMGAMNVFVVRDGALVTPPLSSTILEGVTRRSILELAPHLGLQATEAALNVDEVMSDAASGRISEIAAVGTAAVISPVSRIGFKDTTVELPNRGIGPVFTRVRRALTDIQYGRVEDPFGWMLPVRSAAADASVPRCTMHS